jgi:hypothetical protein
LRGDLPMIVKVKKVQDAFNALPWWHGLHRIGTNPVRFKNCGRYLSSSPIAQISKLGSMTWTLRDIYIMPSSMAYGRPNPGWWSKRR